MTVRTIVMLLHFCAALPLVTLVCSAAEDPLRRDTKYGEVEGFADEQRRVWVWKGIPYAKPPRGKLRWRAPQDPAPWKDVLSAKQAPPICTQLDAAPSWIATPHVIGSEDCLYLNVYRPQGEANNLPVYVWIHGGANITGSAREYYVEGLARKANIVVVVIQYRMNVFGYFTHRALRNGASRAEASGNFGLLDQIKALQWIGDNIAAFGGNPFNVTIAGESAGGHNVMGLMICPLARGLFHRVVMQSGGMVSQDLEQAEEAANRAIETAMVMRGRVQDGDEARRRRLQMSDAQLRDLLEELAPGDLLQAYAGGPEETAVPFGNLIEDGYVIPGKLLQIIRSGRYAKVPIILGSNRSESGSVNTLVESLYEGMPNYQALLEVIQGTKTIDHVLATDRDKELWTKTRYYGSRFWRAIMVDEVARCLRKWQDDVFVYRFDWGENGVCRPAVESIYGAAHAIEVPFFHASTDRESDLIQDSLVFTMFTDGNREGRSALSDAMVCYLAQFVRTGNPNRGDTPLPKWQPWSKHPGGTKSIVFDADKGETRIRTEHDEVSVAGVRFELDQEPATTREHVLTVLTTLHPFMAYDRGDYEHANE